MEKTDFYIERCLLSDKSWKAPKGLLPTRNQFSPNTHASIRDHDHVHVHVFTSEKTQGFSALFCSRLDGCITLLASLRPYCVGLDYCALRRRRRRRRTHWRTNSNFRPLPALALGGGDSGQSSAREFSMGSVENPREHARGSSVSGKFQ